MTPEERRKEIKITEGGKLRKKRPTKEHMKVVIKEKLPSIAFLLASIAAFAIFAGVDFDGTLNVPEESRSSRRDFDDLEMTEEEFLEAKRKGEEEYNRRMGLDDYISSFSSNPDSQCDSDTDDESSVSEEPYFFFSQPEPKIVQANETTERICISENELNLLVQVVQHEVGNSASYFVGYDFARIQQIMARVVINRTLSDEFPSTVLGVLTQPGQFEVWDDLGRYSPYDETTRVNVLAALENADVSSHSVFEMSWNSESIHSMLAENGLNYSFENVCKVCEWDMESQVGSVILTASAFTADGRFLLFAAEG